MFTKLFRRAWSKTPRPAADRSRPKPACRARVELLEDRCLLSANVVLEWNQLALDAIRQAKPNPLVASRALAITQAAVYDAVNAIDRSFAPYFAHVHASHGASLEAAAAQAAHDTLAALFPSQASTFDAALAADLVGIPPGRARQGIEVGHDVAQQILAWRSTDGSDAVVPYTPGTDPGDWQPTPPANLPALAPQWPSVTPFAMTSGSQFRPPAPPALDSAEYAAAFNEVKSLGRVDSTTRTADQTQIALFWKDGAGTAYAFGHWNKIAQAGGHGTRGSDLVSDARLFALLNIATADALIACWDAKYAYNFWRPVTAIRSAGHRRQPRRRSPTPTWTPLLGDPELPLLHLGAQHGEQRGGRGPDGPVRAATTTSPWARRACRASPGRSPASTRRRRKRGRAGSTAGSTTSSTTKPASPRAMPWADSCPGTSCVPLKTGMTTGTSGARTATGASPISRRKSRGSCSPSSATPV